MSIKWRITIEVHIDDGGLSKSTSLTHLLNENDNMDSDNIEVIEHLP